MSTLTEKDIVSCCGVAPIYIVAPTHHEIKCGVCKKEKHIRHDYRSWYDDWTPDWALHRLVYAWNNDKKVFILDQ